MKLPRPPEQSILAVAEEVGADPIVLGAEGMSGLEHALIGSVSEEVLRHDLPAAEAAANVAAIRGLVSQPNSWKAIKQAEAKGGSKAAPVRAAAAKTGAE